MLALLCATTSLAAAAPSRGLTRAESERVFAQNENYAVVVGVDRYLDVPNLNHAVDDARRLESLFEAQGYTVFALTDAQASPKRILRAVDKAARLATNDRRSPQGSVVFAFAGHGFRDGGENYLATGETDPDDLSGTALAVSAVSTALEASGVRQRVLLIDACRNVPGARSVGGPGARGFAVDEDAEGVAVLYSTGARQLSFEDPALGQGVFTHYVAEGLEGGAAAADGLVTFEGLRRYVERRVKRHVIETFDEVQVPYVGGERTGEFVLARVERAPVGSEMGRLTVRTEPRDARVRIMNIEPRYRAGMELALGGRYDVLVTREGYAPYRDEIVLEGADQVVEVALLRLGGGQDEPVVAERRDEMTAFRAARPKSSNAEALGWYQGCEREEAEDCISLGNAFNSGTGIEQSYAHAKMMYERGCNAGHARGCTSLGVMYDVGRGATKDESKAVESYERSCEGGDARGCAYLGVMYGLGQGVTKDESKAVALYERSCEGGDASGCSHLGGVYFNGTGVPKDMSIAVASFRRSCELRQQTACYWQVEPVAFRAAHPGWGSSEAGAWYRGCEEENPLDCVRLGHAFETGTRVAQSDVNAATLYERACERDEALGCSNLGNMYADGRGVLKDESKAMELYEQACELGEEAACKLVKRR